MIGDDVAAALPELRSQAESLLTDTCTVERLTSDWDEALQKTVTTWATVHADLPCALTDPPAAGRSLLTDELTTQVAPIVKVAHDVDGIEPDDRVTLASGPVVYVTDSPVRTHQVLRRLQCRRTK